MLPAACADALPVANTATNAGPTNIILQIIALQAAFTLGGLVVEGAVVDALVDGDDDHGLDGGVEGGQVGLPDT